jgi:S-adenosylmethionine hydrolase
VPLVNTYGEVSGGMPCLLFNSMNLLEFAIGCGNAAELLGRPSLGEKIALTPVQAN